MFKRLVIIAVIAAAIILFFALGLHRYLTLQSLKENRDSLLTYRDNHEAAAVALFMALYIVQTAFALPGAAILSLAAGAVFGVAAGTVYAVAAASIGAGLAFFLTRYLFRDALQQRLGARVEKLNRELEREGLSYLLFLRLVPLFPFFLVNVAAGLTRMPFRTFFIGTAVGIIPGGFIFVNAGASLATVNALDGVATPRVIASLVVLGVFALVPLLYRKFRSPSARGGKGE